MFVGLLTIELHIPGSNSLKSKRSVVKGLKDRIRSRFNVSVCEAPDNDLWQRATLGVASVSGEKSHAVEVLNKVMDLVRGSTDAELIDYSIEVI